MVMVNKKFLSRCRFPQKEEFIIKNNDHSKSELCGPRINWKEPERQIDDS